MNQYAAGPFWRSEQVLAQARALLDDARTHPQPADRFRLAHLAALRSTAALLSACSSPGQRLARRPTSAWVLLSSVVTPLASWASYFAAGAPARAAADAGVASAVSGPDAEELVAAVATFIDVCAVVIDQVGTGIDTVAFDAMPSPPVRHVVLSAKAS